jgi:hypothetical protein
VFVFEIGNFADEQILNFVHLGCCRQRPQPGLTCVSGLEPGSDVLIGLGLIFIAALAAILFTRGNRQKTPPFHSPRDDRPTAFAQNTRVAPRQAAGGQLHAVMEGTFQKRRLMNYAEYRVFKIIENDVLAERTGHRVFAQTSLGEVLQSENSDAFHSINAKRVDFLVVDRAGWPVMAVEYQGSEHYQGTAAARDAVKKEALRKAGIGYVEITPDDNDDQIRFRVREQLGWKASISLEPSKLQVAPAQ